jgi:hypothetical protein
VDAEDLEGLEVEGRSSAGTVVVPPPMLSVTSPRELERDEEESGVFSRASAEAPEEGGRLPNPDASSTRKGLCPPFDIATSEGRFGGDPASAWSVQEARARGRFNP